MTDAERVFALYVQANPVPEPDLLPRTRDEAHLPSIEGSTAYARELVDTYERTKHRPRQRVRRWKPAAVVAAAFVVVLGVLGGVLLLTGAGDGDGGPVATTDASPQIATVVAMYDALNAHDAAAYAAYWAEDAEGWFGPWRWGTGSVPIGSREMYRGFEERRAWGAQFTLSECELADEVVRCLETWDDRVFRGMAGLTYDRGVTYMFDDPATISGMYHTNASWDEFVQFLQAFGPWLRAAHPEIVDAYLAPGFDDSFLEDNWFATPESIAEVTDLIEEFIAQSDIYPLAP